MKKTAIAFAACGLACLLTGWTASTAAGDGGGRLWNARAAAGYLDQRASWWTTWQGSQRDHDTHCVSCHTTAPYAMARPALRRVLGEAGPSAPELKINDYVTTRVRLWKDVEPFYPDQTRGVPKTSESRGTEAILNALTLASRDAAAGALSEDGRRAFDNLWALQMKTGDLSGAWVWLNFHYEPWEADRSPYFGATLAAIAIGLAPNGYASSADIQDRVKPLREYLRKSADTQHLFNRLTVLWASTLWPGLLAPEQQQAIVGAARRAQREDGGWSVASFADWKRGDGTALDTASDGYGTGLAALALQAAGVPRTDPQVGRAIDWLVKHQDAATGRWTATSLNKNRDPASDAGKFMSDAATAYAALALAKTEP
jgi:squalene-hopene/tetraprenyl-beta-curcumene cyclase